MTRASENVWIRFPGFEVDLPPAFRPRLRSDGDVRRDLDRWRALPPAARDLAALLLHPPLLGWLPPRPPDAVVDDPDSPEVLRVPPWVAEQFLRPELAPHRAAIERAFLESGRQRLAFLLKLGTWTIGTREDYHSAAGLALWPRDGAAGARVPSGKDLVEQVAHTLAAALAWIREHPADAKRVAGAMLQIAGRETALEEASRLLGGLEADAGRADLPHVAATLRFGGELLLVGREWLTALLEIQGRWERAITREKRRLYSRRTRPPFVPLERWQEQVTPYFDEVVASLDRLAAPRTATIKALRRRLCGHRGGALWTPLIEWAMQLLKPLGERRAAEVTAAMLRAGFPGLDLDADAVYARYYRAFSP